MNLVHNGNVIPLTGKHERPSVPRDMRIELACISVAESVAVTHLPAAQVLKCWLQWPQDIPFNSIRSAYRSLS